MIITLIVVKGEDEGKAFRLLDGDTKTIGRSSRADIILRDPGVSRQHCRIRLEGGRCFLSDLNSRNATVVNGTPIAEATELESDDVLELGNTRVAVRVEQMARVAQKPREAAASPDADIPSIEIGPETQPNAAAQAEDSAAGLALEPLDDRPREPAARPSVEPSDTAGGPGQAADIAGLVGKVIGGCRVERLLAEDDVGRVYRATQLSIERAVTLKVLSPAKMHDRQAVERFIRQARAAGRLNHPHIVQIYDAGEESGIYFAAIELVEGKSVAQLLRSQGRPFRLTRALFIVEQIAGALDYAHSQSVVHGRITPDVILVSGHNVAKLADLSFPTGTTDTARYASARRKDLHRLCYAAPEQVGGDRRATPRSDTYSLAAVLLAMLTGRSPFRGGAKREILNHIRMGQHDTLIVLRPDAPTKLEIIIDRAMAPEPDQRYDRASELEADIGRVLEQLQPQRHAD